MVVYRLKLLYFFRVVELDFQSKVELLGLRDVTCVCTSCSLIRYCTSETVRLIGASHDIKILYIVPIFIIKF